MSAELETLAKQIIELAQQATPTVEPELDYTRLPIDIRNIACLLSAGGVSVLLFVTEYLRRAIKRDAAEIKADEEYIQSFNNPDERSDQ